MSDGSKVAMADLVDTKTSIPVGSPQPMTTKPQSVLQFASQSTRSAVLELNQQPGLVLFAVGMVGMGVLALVYRDFAMVWQPVPAWVPGHVALACGSGVLMLACGVGLIFRATSAWAVRILFPYLIAWQLLKLPDIFITPGSEGVYLGFGELAVLLAGGWTLFALMAALPETSRLNFLTGERMVRIVRFYFAVWIIPIGLSHLVYVQATADLVPSWLPYRTGWAYLTGVGQMASGLGLLFGVFPRVAAWAEAFQISAYTLLIWLPAATFGPDKDLSKVFPQSGPRLYFTALFISWVIGAGAWVVAQNVPPKHKEGPLSTTHARLG